ncbi:single-stranded-DNA-specific exonuclease RecJ [Candidatus Kaiserbacteria bacterium RIFCSPHIGHO2_01_FULL_53_29]|uniref:Single-stranded-DNA-specific exonuclease RecJ n=1 Tax=Candidatus Kaiserbacteria bacterium RIFCSPHIGHO2_01_FULL_53_29 TaxID=1798480 RepID=A0A1F6CWC3_9BACT|nr:MAG: single-stranded-DNA-specific exonuclease RecJ [Candidatus Kaiserbacteria bacterium RIFCSPHIGHO2_01_FULL_53_29]
MEVSNLVRSLLSKRGIETEIDIASFLNPDYELHTHDPFLLSGMDVAVDRVLRAIERGERIAVYADFDCDGIPGAALLSDFFKRIGYENFEVYLPHRDREGYGFHTEAISALAGRGVKLIITIDVGTNAVGAVAHAKELGVDVIVTDHHEVTELPDAVAVLNPKIVPYPFPHLCGAAVAFKFVQAALAEGKRRKLAAFEKIPDGWEKWLLDMVAIATVADMVPLTGENRVLAHWGLQVLRKSQRAGINALCAKVRLRKKELTEDDIGFSIAPRINAASRMDEPDLALKLLTTTDSNEAENLAAQLEKLNASRKGVVAGIVKQARCTLQQRYGESAQGGSASGRRVIVLGNPEWKPALLGLAANSIMGERGGVVCLWGRDVNGKLKGSCRSDGEVSLVDLFANAGDIFEESGGHKASGGFTVSHEQVHSLSEVLAEAAVRLGRTAASSKVEESAHDFLLSLSEITSALYKQVSMLAPFGIGNEKPLFRITETIVTEVRRFGKEKNHTEVILECRRTGSRARAFDFFRSPEDFSLLPAAGSEASVLGTIERDTFRGGLVLRIVDIVPAA